MKSRISMFFSAIVLVLIPASILAMDAPTMRQWARWVVQAGHMLTRQTPTGNAQAQLNITNDTDPFKTLTKEDQRQIILLLSLYDTAKTLPAAAKIINSLAQVNTQLNALINDPTFCLQLTKHLAYEFNSSYEKVWSALQTECSKSNLISQQELRKDLRHLCKNAKGFNPIFTVQSLNKLLHQGADLNYIYENEGPALIIAIYYGGYDLACALIEAGADPSATDTEGKSALELAVEIAKNDELINCIKQAIAKQQTR